MAPSSLLVLPVHMFPGEIGFAHENISNPLCSPIVRFAARWTGPTPDRSVRRVCSPFVVGGGACNVEVLQHQFALGSLRYTEAFKASVVRQKHRWK